MLKARSQWRLDIGRWRNLSGFQKHGWGVYGQSCGIAGSQILSEQDYDEETQFLLTAFSRGIRGVHTFNQQPGIVVFRFS